MGRGEPIRSKRGNASTQRSITARETEVRIPSTKTSAASAPSLPKSAPSAEVTTSLAQPRLPREHVLQTLATRRVSNPMTALVQKLQQSPATTAVVLGAIGAVTLTSMAPREALALEQLDLTEKVAERASSPREQELKDKVQRLVERRFGGDYRSAFDHYDGSNGRGISRKELLRLLDDAGIGNLVTRGVWADGILEKIDAQHGNGDGRIQWPEFQRVISRAG